MEKFPECFNECICGCGRCSIPHVDKEECPDLNCPFSLPSANTRGKVPTLKELTKEAPKFLEIDKCTDLSHMLQVNLMEDLRRLISRHPLPAYIDVSISVVLSGDSKCETIATTYQETTPRTWERIRSVMTEEG